MQNVLQIQNKALSLHQQTITHTTMKKVEITVKNGTTYRGLSNGKTYGKVVYINRTKENYISITKNGETFEDRHDSLKIDASAIVSIVEL